jgi:hypothetical protein
VDLILGRESEAAAVVAEAEAHGALKLRSNQESRPSSSAPKNSSLSLVWLVRRGCRRHRRAIG